MNRILSTALSITLGVFLILFAQPAYSDAYYEYEYTGSTFDFFDPENETNVFYPNGYVVGRFILSAPLEGNLIWTRIVDDILEYSFEGVGGPVLTNDNSGLLFAKVSTDAAGEVIDWNVRIVNKVETIDDPMEVVLITSAYPDYSDAALHNGDCHIIEGGLCTGGACSIDHGCAKARVETGPLGTWDMTVVPDPERILECDGFGPPMDDGPVTMAVRGRQRALPLWATLYDTEDGSEVTDADIAAPPILQVQHEYIGDDGQLVIEDVSDDAVPTALITEGNEFVYLGDAKWEYILNTRNFTGEGVYVLTMKSGSTDYAIDPTCEAEFVRQK